MRRQDKHQRIDIVDIDEYFHGFEDLTDALTTQASWPPAPTPSPPLKAMLVGSSGPAAPVLAPYHYQSSILSQPKPLNPFELESAHRAVASMKHQLLGQTTPGLQTRVFPPAAAVDLAGPGGVSPSAVVQGTPRLGWGRILAVLGTTVAALAIYAYGSPRLQPDLAQGKPLSPVTWAQIRHLGRQPLQRVRLALPPQMPVLSANPTADHDTLAQSMRFAYTAAELTQSALTEEDWQQVILFWRRAIDELQPIQAGSPLFASAQERRQIYQANFDYAQGEREMAPFRLAVQAAESASEMAANARTTEDWGEVAATWQEALIQMKAVSAQSDRHGIAQAKQAEYATKFAYAQTRYLALQPQGTR